MPPIDDLSCDVLILGAGGAGMLAALHVTTANPQARIVIAVKGLIGQSGCTRMVQGGYNCVLNSADHDRDVHSRHHRRLVGRRRLRRQPAPYAAQSGGVGYSPPWYNSTMTTKLTDEQRKAVEACAGQPVQITDEATNKTYYLLNEEAFAHLRGLQSAHEGECQSQLRQLIDEGIRSKEIPADKVFADLRAEANKLAHAGP